MDETVSTLSIFIVRVKGSLNMTWVWFSPEEEAIFQGDRQSKWQTTGGKGNA